MQILHAYYLYSYHHTNKHSFDTFFVSNLLEIVISFISFKIWRNFDHSFVPVDVKEEEQTILVANTHKNQTISQPSFCNQSNKSKKTL